MVESSADHLQTDHLQTDHLRYDPPLWSTSAKLRSSGWAERRSNWI